MLYLIHKKSLGLNCMKRYSTSFYYEVTKVVTKNLTAGEIYNSENYVYSDNRKELYHMGYTIRDDEEIQIVIKIVRKYKLNIRLNKLKKINVSKN